jgi:hypothetical protein
MANGFNSEAQRAKWDQLLSEGKVTLRQYALRALDSPTTDEQMTNLFERGAITKLEYQNYNRGPSLPTLPERTTPRKRTVGASRAPNAAHHPRY